MADDLTGRDHYILSQALAYAITVIERLPPQQQELSNLEDMRRLLRHRVTEESRAVLLTSARQHIYGHLRPIE